MAARLFQALYLAARTTAAEAASPDKKALRQPQRLHSTCAGP